MIAEIILIAVLVSVACAIPGVFLVLRKMSLMSDAISHAVLPGIVVGFLITHTLASPLLFIGAVATGLLTVVLSELLVRTSLVKEDAAIGLVFPALFSIGVILVSQYTGNVHLDTDAVLLGELVFTPLDRIIVQGIDLGPRTAWVMGFILIMNIALFLLFFKELKLATFDPGLAASIGFSPSLIQYILMIDVSITTVGAFDAVGSILVVALMIAPAATAYLLTDDLRVMVLLAVLFAILSSIIGFWASWIMDASAAGAMASIAGLFFLAAFLFAPDRGIVSIRKKRKRQKIEFGISMLAVHLLHHRDEERSATECSEDHLLEHINWDVRFAHVVLSTAISKGLIRSEGHVLRLTHRGISFAREAMSR
ncbi:metal ABC transporter permease [Sediminispirochaeta bajacaliforniensis]|uniref:metal ABC transporter permease n=1 Tax=Sediminispirochaeta bajacaliforniensis TaxID=148 RepID=UPI00035CDE75|nr:metal ABC transporter permease [Sediminispirochaeta bajacaliforniensis]